eukprot:scaffold175184_cov42-Prasinocladus_malaysianus.AAC.1
MVVAPPLFTKELSFGSAAPPSSMSSSLAWWAANFELPKFCCSKMVGVSGCTAMHEARIIVAGLSSDAEKHTEI